jgi:hypothetical protein
LRKSGNYRRNPDRRTEARRTADVLNGYDATKIVDDPIDDRLTVMDWAGKS